MANIPGTNGEDDLIGTADDDLITPLDSNGTDRITASGGDDTLVFTSAQNGFFDLYYDVLDAAIIVNIDTSSDDGTIDKGANGFDTLVDVDRAINGQTGMYLEGTDFNDVYNISVNDDDYFHYQAGGGTDTHNLTLNGGVIRMDFRGGNQGLNINLATQTILNDGFGNSESLTFTNNGGRIQIQATDFSDVIVGSSNNEDFILNSGNDTVAAGGGTDTLRFDRNDMDSVTVDLAAGTATGMYDGNAFSHTFTGIENVRGARDADDDDVISGDGGENRLEGRGGDDELNGRGGDDDLIGGDGDDELNGGSGNNYLEGGDGDDMIDASDTDADGFGDYIKPGAGANTIIGSLDLWDNNDGIDLAYDDVSGSGGLNITVGADGSGTTISNIGGIVSDTFTYAHFFIGSHDDDVFVGNNEDRFEGWRGNAGDDTINGRGGYDRLEYYWEADGNNAAQGVIVNLNTGMGTDTYGDTDSYSNIEGIEGTNFADTFTGKDNSDYSDFRGLGGDDTINGTATGYEQLDYSRDDSRGGGAGINANLATGMVIDGFGDTDTVSEIDGIRGTDHDDVMVGSSAGEYFSDQAGDDDIEAGGGNDTLRAGTGMDSFDGGSGTDKVIIDVSGSDDHAFQYDFDMNTGVSGSFEFPDLLDSYTNVEDLEFYGHIDADVIGTSGRNVIRTSDGDDHIQAGKGNDEVHLGGGNDYVRAGGGVEEFYGGSGKDWISYYDSSNGVTLNLATNAASGSWASNDVVEDFESVSGSRTGDDHITGTTGANVIKTYGGDDRVYAGKGGDRVELGSGDDYVRAGGGVEEFYGGSGKDYISYYDSSGGIIMDMAANTITGSWANNDVVEDFESVSGSKNGDDDITGTSGSNTIRTYGGDDRVSAGLGEDKVELGAGDDYVRVGGGKESFDGGSGKDYISYYSSTGGIRIDLRDDEVSGSWAVNDTIKDFESASGSKNGDDVMLGTSGSNTFKSYGGEDKLYGRSGDDKLYGGDDEDYFDGGHGDDLLYGGDDADVFHFDAGEDNDTIKDFENNIDTIEFDNFGLTKAQVLAKASQVGSDVVFDFGADGTLTIEDATVAMFPNDIDIV